MRKTKIKKADGSLVDATIIDVNSSQENWNQYLLSDGTVLKIKVFVTDVVRVDDEYDNEGTPVYVVKSANIVSVNSPENLKKPL